MKYKLHISLRERNTNFITPLIYTQKMQFCSPRENTSTRNSHPRQTSSQKSSEVEVNMHLMLLLLHLSSWKKMGWPLPLSGVNRESKIFGWRLPSPSKINISWAWILLTTSSGFMLSSFFSHVEEQKLSCAVGKSHENLSVNFTFINFSTIVTHWQWVTNSFALPTTKLVQ